MIITFQCKRNIDGKIECWDGIIPKFENYGSHFEIRIESRSGIMVLFGETTQGGFVCMPDHDVGCHLGDLRNRCNLKNSTVAPDIIC